jgi:glycosyltransferase involved in cell wall biosynthesis
MKIGYVIKSYPRLSQTFIVNELLAHERAGLPLEIFSLRPPKDEPRHASVERVKAPVNYIPGPAATGAEFWETVCQAGAAVPGFWPRLGGVAGEPVAEVFQAVTLARLVGERGITHLHAHFGNVATSVARIASALAGIRYSFTAHARDIFHQKVVPQELRRKLADAGAVVTVSEYNLAFLHEHYGAAAKRVRRVYNGLDMADFAYADPVGRPAVIISVGRLVEKKGFPVLVEACGELARRGVEFRCELVGDGPLEPVLAARINALGLGNRVRLLGLRRQEEVKGLVQGAAVMAAPCVVGEDGDMDGLPTVILEAMALGTPCVGTDVTGIPEVLRDDETGLMVSQQAVGSLADALERLLRDENLRVRLARSARELVEREFDIHRNAERIRAMFAELAAH